MAENKEATNPELPLKAETKTTKTVVFRMSADMTASNILSGKGTRTRSGIYCPFCEDQEEDKVAKDKAVKEKGQGKEKLNEKINRLRRRPPRRAVTVVNSVEELN